jgi:phage minor structural protein
LAELYIFSQYDELLTVITEETGLVSAPFREELNRVAEEPFSFIVEADSEDAKYVVEENQVVFRDKEGDLRLFVIKELDDIDNVEGPQTKAICEPAFMELKEHIIVERRPTNVTQQQALNVSLEGTRWIGEVEVDFDLNSTHFYYISSVDAIWKIIDTWGGDFKDVVEFDEKNNIVARKIKILQRRGADRGKRFEIEYDIEQIQRTVLSYPVTALYGRGASLEILDEEGEHTGGYTRFIDFAAVEWSKAKGDPVDKPLGQKWVGDPVALEKYGYLKNDGSKLHRFRIVENHDIEDPEELLEWTWQQLQNLNKPEVNYGLSVHLLEMLAGYEHEHVELGDTAAAIDRQFARPIEIQSRVIAIEYDLVDIEGTAFVEMGQFLSAHEDDVYRDIEDLKDRVSRPTPPVTNERFPNLKPGTPTNVEAVGGFRTIQLYWDYDSSVYVSHYEVYGSQVKGFIPDSQHLLYRGRTSSFAHEVNTDEVWYYRIRAVNTHGTPGDFSEEVSASTVRIISDDILFGEGIAAELRELSKVADILAQGTVNSSILADDVKSFIDNAVTSANNAVNIANIATQSAYDAITQAQSAFDTAEDAIVKANEVTGELSIIAQTVQGLQTQVSNAEGNISTVTQLANALQARLTNAEGDISALTQTASSLQSTISSINEDLENVESQISQLAHNVNLRVEKGDVINQINLSTEGILIDGSKLHITALTTIENGVIGTAAIADAAITRAKLGTAVVGTAQIEDAAITNAKIASLSADKITTGAIRGIDIYGSQFRSSDGNTRMTITGGNIQLTQSNGNYVQINPNGLIGYNNRKERIFQANLQLVTSGALGTNTDNVYLAAQSGKEARVVDMNGIPGDGEIASYSYLPLRADGIYGNFVETNGGTNAIHLYLRPRSGGEVRITGANTTDAYYPLRAGRIYSNGFITTSTSLWMGTDSALHVVNKGYVENSSGNPIYRDIYANEIWSYGFITQSTHAYIGSDGELRVQNKGLTGVYRDVRARYFYGNAIDVNTGTHIYLRPAIDGVARVTRIGTTGTYRPIEALSFDNKSLAEYKDYIELFTESALEIIRNTEIYKFQMKSDIEIGQARDRYGLVIGEEYRTPKEFLNYDKTAVDLYAEASIAIKAIQELDEEQYNLKNRITCLEIENDYLKQKIKELEAMVA